MKHDIFSQMALDALLHGLRYLRDNAENTIHEIEQSVASNGAAPPAKVKAGRPKGPASERKRGWSDDPEERKAEMARRSQVTLAKRAAAGKPARKKRGGAAIKDKEKWRENVSRAAKAAWARLSPAERSAKVNRILAGRRRVA